MFYLYKLLIISLVIVISGCTFNGKNNIGEILGYDAEKDFRDTETQLANPLEVPPNLFLKARQSEDLRHLIAGVGVGTSARDIPNFKADNLQLKNNLSARWLEIEGSNSEEVWQGVQALLVSMGFDIKEQRRDIGFIKTDFLERTEFAPLHAQGVLTRLFNRWRPELARGKHDRIVARIEHNNQQNITKVFFHHHMITEPTKMAVDVRADEFAGSAWQIRSFNPMFEAEMLYQAMIFFGATAEEALQQIKISPLFFEGKHDDEITSINFRASKDKSWDYFVAMVHRLGWVIEEVDKANYIAQVSLPKDNQLTRHNLVKFQFKSITTDEVSHSNLTVVNTDAGFSISATERKKLFQALGLLK